MTTQQHILQLRSRGKTLQEIADEVGVTRLDVKRTLDRLGIR
ncbi:hypothetical protein ACRQ5Q_15020 [Bradyrhizobium sp. PMVTL-01]